MRLNPGRPRQIPIRFRPSDPGHCVVCNDSGFRPVAIDGERRVTRCECRTDRKVDEMKIVNVLDKKSAAAGDR
jgi:hypothetical protein